MGTGLNRSLFQAKTATSLQGPAVHTPELLIPRPLGIKHLGNASALKNCLNPSRKAVLSKHHQYYNTIEQEGREQSLTLLYC